jgi:methionyl aminopeptidase
VNYGGHIPLKSRHDIDRMRVASRHVAEILLEIRALAKPGVTTAELERASASSIERRGVISSFKGYGPHGLPAYPATMCMSVNEEIVHGIPGSRELLDGDILGLDFGVIHEGFHGDSAVTVPIGTVSDEALRLLDATRQALYQGIEQMRPGNRLSDIGHAVQTKAEGLGYTVVKDFVGHGIGRSLHEPPQIPNYGPPGRGPRLRAGMVFAIEPMVNIGSPGVRMLDDEWTAVTEDGSLSAHFEHTILITDDGPEILTRVEGSH